MVFEIQKKVDCSQKFFGAVHAVCVVLALCLVSFCHRLRNPATVFCKALFQSDTSSFFDKKSSENEHKQVQVVQKTFMSTTQPIAQVATPNNENESSNIFHFFRSGGKKFGHFQ